MLIVTGQALDDVCSLNRLIQIAKQKREAIGAKKNTDGGQDIAALLRDAKRKTAGKVLKTGCVNISGDVRDELDRRSTLKRRN